MCTSQNPSFNIVDAQNEEGANEKHNNSRIHMEAKSGFDALLAKNEKRNTSFTHGKDHN